MERPKLNYIELVNQLWTCQKEHLLTPNEIAVYFYLLETSNSLGWKNPFFHSNGSLCACLNISEKSLQSARNTLKQVGLIEFKSGNGRRNITEYKLKLRKRMQDVTGKYISTEEKGDEKDTQKVENNSTFTEKDDEKVAERYPERLPKGIPKGSNNDYLYPRNYLDFEDDIDPLKLNKTKQDLEEKKENIPKEKKVLSPEEIVFDEGRKMFPGTKRGLETEFENFRKKHKDWKSAAYLIKAAVEAEIELDNLEEKWNKKYPIVIKSWRNNWENLSTYFAYTPMIRKMIYTTNTVEGYHRQVRKVTKTKGPFTSDMALIKLIYLASLQIMKKWTQPVQNWGLTIQQLAIRFGEDRLKLSI